MDMSIGTQNPGARRAVTRGVGVATLALAGVTLAACGSSNLDAQKLQNTITAKINEVAPGAQVTVSCPSDIKPQQGGTFQCSATVNGQQVNLAVTQNDDKGNVSYKSEQAFLSLEKAQTKISEQLAQQIPGDWKTTCEPQGATNGIYVAAPQATFDCTVSGTSAAGASQTGTVVVTVTDSDGNITWKLQQGDETAAGGDQAQSPAATPTQ